MLGSTFGYVVPDEMCQAANTEKAAALQAASGFFVSTLGFLCFLYSRRLLRFSGLGDRAVEKVGMEPRNGA